MRQVVVRDELRVEEAPRPEPAEGEILVEVGAIGVTLPVVRKPQGTPGGEVAGRVVAVGPGVTTAQVGQHVTGLAFTGAYAEFALVRADMAVPVPDGVDDATAVAVVRSGQVALGALRAAPLHAGESVVVTAAAGGVGHLAVQLATVLGASRVVGAVSTDAKAAFLRSLGVSEVVRYDEPWGEPVDVVLDGVGGSVQATGVSSLAPLGRLVSYNATGAMVDVNELRFHGRTIVGFAMPHLVAGRPDVYKRQQTELWDMCLSGSLRPSIHGTFPLDQAAEAHRIILARENLGKVVLVP
jgi:NADPH2:quinone reductase